MSHDTRLSDVCSPLVHLQMFATFDIEVIKSSDSTHSVKIYALLPGMMSTVLQLFGPEKLGGKGNIRVKAQREAESSGSPYEEVVEKVCAYSLDIILPIC